MQVPVYLKMHFKLHELHCVQESPKKKENFFLKKNECCVTVIYLTLLSLSFLFFIKSIFPLNDLCETAIKLPAIEKKG